MAYTGKHDERQHAVILTDSSHVALTLSNLKVKYSFVLGEIMFAMQLPVLPKCPAL
jgi:hypothetical protein